VENSGCSAAEPFALRVLGDSMLPEFREGHIIIIDPGMPIAHGAYVVADYNGDTTFRQFVIDDDGKKYLKPLNDDFDTVEIDGPCKFHGVVIQRAGTRRKEHKHYF
jgi:DNA polymerase V